MRLRRRDVVQWAVATGLFSSCEGPFERGPTVTLPTQRPSRVVEPAAPFADATDALFDVFLPIEKDSSGRMTSPGARETGVNELLEVEHFARLAVAQGFIRPLPEAVLLVLDDVSGVMRSTLNRALDTRAQLERPMSVFAELDRPTQEKVVQHLFADEALEPALLVLRAACFLAWLGASTTDAGLIAIGFPPFEDFDDGLASTGYPRTRSGRRVDAAREDLVAMRARGELDDYTMNAVPPPTPGDDLSAVLTPEGDLR